MLSTLTYVAGFSASKDYATLFLAFKHEHAKHYDSAAAEAQAFKAFSENEDIIASHNAKNLAYKLGHNEYSDLSKDDFWTLHFKPGFDAKKAKPAATSLHVTSNAALPDARVFSRAELRRHAIASSLMEQQTLEFWPRFLDQRDAAALAAAQPALPPRRAER